MKFAEIIRNAGLDASQYPECSDIHTRLVNGKDRINFAKTINYAKPLFAENPDSKKKFTEFLNELEKTFAPASMFVKVDADSVILFYTDPRATTFLRKKPMDPLDYMD